MCNAKLCNGCINLVKVYDDCENGRFDAACGLTSFKTIYPPRPRRIDFNLTLANSIVAPFWCPMRENNEQAALPSPSQVTTPQPTKNELTYTERRERLKQLPKHMEWDDIKEGHVYVIPKIMSQPRKIVKVMTKTNLCCSCHEINIDTNTEYSFSCSIYPSDIDTVFITELHNF